MKVLQKFIRQHCLLVILWLFFFYLFFWKLDWNTLTSWDEGWYASIARAMVRSGNYLIMDWNGSPFYDHPPFGMWMMALSYHIFGFTEFGTRVPSVLCGLGSVIIMYLLGYELSKKKIVGFVAALILGTSAWYLIRVRSGNLDAPFVFFYVLTIYSALQSIKRRSWLVVLGGAFGALLMTKTLVGLSAAPLILFILWPELPQFFKKDKKFIIGAIVLWGVVVLPWYIIHFLTFGDFFNHHFLKIGTREKTFSSYFEYHWEQPLFFLHMGVRKWYYLWLISFVYIVAKQVLYLVQRLTKKVIVRSNAQAEWLLICWNVFILYPFLTSEQTELWHLIPVYVPLALSIAYAFYDGAEIGVDIVERFIKFLKFVNLPTWLVMYLLPIGYVTGFLLIALVQLKILYPEVYPTSQYIPDDVAISRLAGKYNKRIMLDDDYTPIAVFYSGKNVQQIRTEPPDRQTLPTYFKSSEQDFIVVTRNWALEQLKKEGIPYKVLNSNNSFSIVTRPDKL